MGSVDATALAEWSDFNVAMVGASAALAGLLIVAISVNIAEIMKGASLPARGLVAIATLVLALITGALGLVPGQPLWLYGLEIFIVAAIVSGFQVNASRLIFKDKATPSGQRPFFKILAGSLPIAAYLVAGVLLLLSIPAGLGVAAVGMILALVSPIVFAWVALVEVLR